MAGLSPILIIGLSAAVIVPSAYGKLGNTEQPCSLTQGVSLLDIGMERTQSALMSQIKDLSASSEVTLRQRLLQHHTALNTLCFTHGFYLGYKMAESKYHVYRTLRRYLYYRSGA